MATADPRHRLSQHQHLVAPASWPRAARHPLGPPPSVLAAAHAAACHLAADATDPQLLRALADHAGVAPERVVVAASADALLGAVCQILLGPGDRVALAAPAAPELLRAVLLVGARYVDVGRDAEHALQVPFLERALADGDVCLTALGRPAPITGLHAPAGAIAAALAAGSNLLLDTRHAGFSLSRPEPPPDDDRLIVVDDLATRVGLGPLGIAWAVAATPLAERLRRALPPHALSQAAVAAALEALGPARSEVMSRARAVARLRDTLRADLDALPGWRVVAGEGPALLVRRPGTLGAALAAQLSAAGLPVVCDPHPSWRDAVRLDLPPDPDTLSRWAAAVAAL